MNSPEEKPHKIVNLYLFNDFSVIIRRFSFFSSQLGKYFLFTNLMYLK